MDVDELIERLLSSERDNGSAAVVTVEEIYEVCKLAIPIFQNEENVIRIQTPLSICGDIHGDFDNLAGIFDIFGKPPNSRYLFLGDYVDRGAKSVETVMILLCYKIKYPDDVFLIRGNHETTLITINFGFYNEIATKYGDFSVWRSFMEVFTCLPLAAVVDSKLFCVHGGLCPNLSNISDLEFVNRFLELPIECSLIQDVLWSDPFEGYGFEASSRRAGYKWGQDISNKFVQENKIDMIVRGHEQKVGGFQLMHGDTVCTVFSTPNYVNRFTEAAVFEAISPTERELTRFRPIQWEQPDMNAILFSNQSL